jgi:outer membrane protein TolC
MRSKVSCKKQLTALASATAFSAIVFMSFSTHVCNAQQTEFKQFDANSIFHQLDANSTSSQQALMPAWWNEHVAKSLRDQQPIAADIHTLLYLAVHHSNQIKIAKRDPLIRETAIQEADSNFDWVRYLDTAWNDTSEPISNTLTAGGTATRFNDNTFQLNGGVRRLTRSGGQLDIGQRFGWQDNNSTFFIPDNQATGQMTLSYTHPLLRGRGQAYNNSIVFLAQIDAEVAEHEFMATLQEELLEVTRGYWALYLERSVLAHQMRLFLKTQQIFQTLKARQAVDTQRTQLITASAALENRRADLIRARTAVTNAETRLRGLINAPELQNSDQAELIPVEPPSEQMYPADLQAEIQMALQNRPEAMAAIQQVKAGSTRLGVAQHELLPALNLVTQGYANGLRGDSDFGGAFGDQFTVGRPSYSLGVQYQMPVGNRLAKARLCRRQHELSRLQDEYARALQIITTEVDIAVRELHTSYLEINAKSRALAAAEAEADTIEQRWLRMIDGNGSAALNLESLLRSQERVTEAEREYVTSLLTYNLAMVNLKRTNGTLLQSENVMVSKSCENGCSAINLDKGAPSSQTQGIQEEVMFDPQFDTDFNGQLPAGSSPAMPVSGSYPLTADEDSYFRQ